MILGLAGMLCTACNDSFLDRFPEDAISEKNFFKSVADLETYTNSFYNWGPSTSDGVCDNIITSGDGGNVFKKMNGLVNPNNVGQWDWNGDGFGIRSMNFFLTRANQASGDQTRINHFIGLGKLYRARAYYGKVQSYSDVPWYDRDLQTTDEEELYKPQDSRSFVVDKIFEDLDFAIENMQDESGKTKIGKVIAIYEKARIALNEGTFRKYHPELELNDYDKYLQMAVAATEEIMNNYDYSISTAMNGTMPPYRALFSSLSLTANPEVILMADYDKSIGRKYHIGTLMNYDFSMSRDLMEDYLVKVDDNTAVPFTSLPGYETMTVKEVYENRDPRMGETFMPMGWVKDGDKKPQRQKMEMGGYPQVKFCMDAPKDMWGWGEAYNDLPVIRYASVLLMNAEAKAELGVLTQTDVDNTINQLRRRVNMPDAKLSEWLANPDPVQMKRYKNINSTQAGAVAEIRRERRIELACEGVRYNDLMRWACGKLLENVPQGAYIPGYGYYDTNGDDIEDVGFFANKADADAAFEGLSDEAKENVTNITMEDSDVGQSIVLSEGDHGYIMRKTQVDYANEGWEWVEPRYYYSPVSVKDIQLNENLYQNKFWVGE